jgi:hypothetical protein
MALLLIAGAGGVQYAFAQTAPPLGASSQYVVLAETEITNTGTSAITGNLGLSPSAHTFLSGFGMTEDSSDQFWTSPQVTGNIYAADNAPSTPSSLGTAITNMLTAYTTANGESCGNVEGTTALSGQTLATGVYCWTDNAVMTGSITLTGTSNAVWIFQIPGTFTVSSAVSVILAGGATDTNVFWVVGGQTIIGSTANFQGIILDGTSIALQTGAILTGQALAQAAVTLQGNIINGPPSTRLTVPATGVPEFPTGVLLLAVPVLAIYFLMRGKGSRVSARIRLADAWARPTLQLARCR